MQPPGPRDADTSRLFVRSRRRPLPPGTPVGGRFVLGQCLGEGGTATVYAGVDAESGAPVALKVFPQDLPSARASAQREVRAAQALAGLSGFLALRGEGTLPSGDPFVATDLVEEAQPLALASGPLLERLARLELVMERVAQAHERGVVHHDLKPDNVLLARDGRVHLIDFACAQLHDPLRGPTPLPAEAVGLGTPSFMPPEQFDDEGHVDPRTDVYALGVMLFLTLTGCLPYPGGSLEVLGALMRARSQGSPRRVRSLFGELPQSLDELCAEAMALRPRDRVQSARALLERTRALRVQEGELLLSLGATSAEPPPTSKALKRLLESEDV